MALALFHLLMVVVGGVVLAVLELLEQVQHLVVEVQVKLLPLLVHRELLTLAEVALVVHLKALLLVAAVAVVAVMVEVGHLQPMVQTELQIWAVAVAAAVAGVLVALAVTAVQAS